MGELTFFWPAVRQSQSGRAMSGIAIFIMLSIVKYFKWLSRDCSWNIPRGREIIVQSGTKYYYCFKYLPPEKLPLYRDTEAAGIKLLESHLLKQEFIDKNDLFIMGDLNARVAKRPEFVNDNHVVPCLRDYEEYLLDEEIDTNQFSFFLQVLLRNNIKILTRKYFSCPLTVKDSTVNIEYQRFTA